jgi:hypothetical protein
MSDPTQTIGTKPIRVWFRPYNHDEVSHMLSQLYAEFGRPGRRWRYRSPDIGLSQDDNVWVLDFYFAVPYDATMFSLKYLK